MLGWCGGRERELPIQFQSSDSLLSPTWASMKRTWSRAGGTCSSGSPNSPRPSISNSTARRCSTAKSCAWTRAAQPQFYDLLRRRGSPVFYAFDLLSLGGEDLRSRPLVERKRLLRSIEPDQPSVMLYAEHIERTALSLRREVVQDPESQIFAVRGPEGAV
jgi:hypothetical protein